METSGLQTLRLILEARDREGRKLRRGSPPGKAERPCVSYRASTSAPVLRQRSRTAWRDRRQSDRYRAEVVDCPNRGALDETPICRPGGFRRRDLRRSATKP